MRTFLIFCMMAISSVVLAGEVAIIEAIVDDEPGTLKVFEVAEPASWLVVPENNCWRVDSDAKKLYFASPKQGSYTVIASVKDEKEPSGIKILSKTFQNGGGKSNNDVVPADFSSFVLSCRKEVTTGTDVEAAALAKAFNQAGAMIDDGTVITVQSARMALKNVWVGLAEKETIAKWNPFFTAIGEKLENENLSMLRTQFSQIAGVLTTKVTGNDTRTNSGVRTQRR